MRASILSEMHCLRSSIDQLRAYDSESHLERSILTVAPHSKGGGCGDDVLQRKLSDKDDKLIYFACPNCERWQTQIGETWLGTFTTGVLVFKKYTFITRSMYDSVLLRSKPRGSLL